MELIKSQPVNIIESDLDLIHDYEQSMIQNNYPQETIKKYIKTARRFQSFIQSENRRGVMKSDVIDFLNQNPNISPSTWNNYLTYLKQFFKFLQSEKMMMDITAGIRSKRVKREFKKESIPENVVLELYQYFERRVELAFESNDKRVKPLAALRNLAYFSILISLGSRAGKTTLIRIRDVREKVTRLGNVPAVGVPSKGFHDVKLRPVQPFVFSNIERYLKHLGDYSKDDFLFQSSKKDGSGSTPISYDQMLKVITKALKTLGIKNDSTHNNVISPHSFRHTVGEMILSEKGLNYLQDFFDHSSINTSKMYAGRNKENELFESPPDIEKYFNIK